MSSHYYRNTTNCWTVLMKESLGPWADKSRRFINLFNGDAIFNSEDAGREDPLPPDDGSPPLEVSITFRFPGQY